MTPRTKKVTSAKRSPRRETRARHERLRMFSPSIIPLVRADIAAAHGTPGPAEPSIMEFVEQFFDDLRALRETITLGTPFTNASRSMSIAVRARCRATTTLPRNHCIKLAML